ncbi:MAG: hypothetical protein OXI91_15295 [Chloroflexota bacterium]|nr:hypothetical protein [Chloroflexota bacterium]
MVQNDEIAELHIDAVAERPLIPVTRFEDDGRVRVEWEGRCWVWLAEAEPPVMVDVVVPSGEVVKLLAPGQVRRVRARMRPAEASGGASSVFEIWIDLDWTPPEDRRAVARGLFEGGMVRVAENTMRDDIRGKIGRLLRFPSATVEVEGRGHVVSIMDLEPVEEPAEPAGEDLPA